MSEFLSINQWEQDNELKLSIEDQALKSLVAKLGIYSNFINWGSLETDIQYEYNNIFLDLDIPKNFVSNFDKNDIEKEIKEFITGSDFKGVYYAEQNISYSKTQVNVKDNKNYWKVNIHINWGLNV